MHMWTTPILRENLFGPESELPADLIICVENAVLRRFRAFAETYDPTTIYEKGETINDRFFDMQREAWEAGRPSFLEEMDESDRSREATDSSWNLEELEAFAFRALRAAWLDRIYEYVSSAAS
eukprot:5323994-Prymnesium_polylepis.1